MSSESIAWLTERGYCFDARLSIAALEIQDGWPGSGQELAHALRQGGAKSETIRKMVRGVRHQQTIWYGVGKDPRLVLRRIAADHPGFTDLALARFAASLPDMPDSPTLIEMAREVVESSGPAPALYGR